jgi:hypothetical protein
MTVWTISAEEGAGGATIAADLASAADVPLLDFKTLATRAQSLVGDVPDLEDLEERVGGRFNAILLSVALMARHRPAHRPSSSSGARCPSSAAPPWARRRACPV